MRKTRNPSARAPLSNVQHPRNRPEKTLHRPRGAPPGGRFRPDPAGGAAVGRDVQDLVPESRRVPAAAAAGRDARDVVGVGDDAGERGEQGEWSGHADRGADARESMMLVTESFRRLPRGTRRKPPSALVAEGATTTTCCGRG